MSDELNPEVTDETTLTSDAAPDSSAVSDETLSGDAVTATETAAPEQAAQPSEASFTSIRDYFTQNGLDASRFESDEAAVSTLLKQAQAAQQYQQQLAYYQHQLSQMQQQQPTAQPAPQPVEKKPYWTKPPEYDPAWRNLLKTDESGNIVAVPGAAPDLPQKYRAYVDWQQKQLNTLLSDPVEAIWGGVQERLDALLAEREQKILSTYQQDLDARSYLQNTVLPRFYVTDPGTGQPRIDPTTGQPAVSPWGQAFQHYLNQASQMTPDPQARRQFAEMQANAYVATLPQQPAPPAAPPAASAEARKKNFLQAQHRPNRSGTEVEETPNRSLSFGEKLRAELQRTGHISESAA